MKLTLRGLAALLTYPSLKIRQNIGEIRFAFVEETALSRAELRRLEPLLESLATGDELDLQSAYSELFDRSRSLSLHLFEHVHGDNRERGQAMIDLGEQYTAARIFLDARELPDFIPVFLEYVSCLEPGEARETLAQPAHVFAALAERLDSKGADYAAIFHALVALAARQPSAEEKAELATNSLGEDPGAEDPGRIDEEWEEAPVSFEHAGAHAMGGPNGPVAKIRAANRPIEQGGEQ